MSENNTDALNEQYGESSFEAAQDARDVYKALSDFVTDKERTLPMHDADWIEFARYFAQRCGVIINEKQ
jgi:hypothetical protein